MEGGQAIEVADWWINKVATWGLSFVFLACVLLILLYLALALVGISREWIPKWIKASIDSHEAVRTSIGRLERHLDCIHDNTHACKEGILHNTKAAAKFAAKNRSKYEISSDVFMHLESAQDVLNPSSSRYSHEHDPLRDTLSKEDSPNE